MFAESEGGSYGAVAMQRTGKGSKPRVAERRRREGSACKPAPRGVARQERARREGAMARGSDAHGEQDFASGEIELLELPQRGAQDVGPE